MPYFSEFTKTGKLVFDGVMPSPDMTYRAYLEPWVGEPLTRPSAVARTRDRQITVYASWNGAPSWLRGGCSPHSKGATTTVAVAEKSGFQTTIPVSSRYATFRVEASTPPATSSAHQRALGHNPR